MTSGNVSASLDVNPFTGEGGAYDSVHPTYSDEAVAALIGATQRAWRENMPGRSGPLRAADIGAGTGKMSELLAHGGLLVDAVGPSKAIYTQASSIEGVTWHGGVAEGIGLLNGTYGIVVFAQSWYWMDPERTGLEVVRILTPDGALAITWDQMAVSILWVHRLTCIMRSGDVHHPDRLSMPGGGLAPIALTQVIWGDRITPEEIPALGTTRFLYICLSEVGRARVQENLCWCLCGHLGYAPGELITIPYVTLTWFTHLREVGKLSARGVSE